MENFAPGEREAQGDEEVKEEKRAGIDWTACREPVGPAGRPGLLKGGWGFGLSFRCPCFGLSGAGRRRDGRGWHSFFLHFWNPGLSGSDIGNH